MSNFLIRRAVLADLPGILHLVNELAVYEKEPEAVTASLADYERDFDNIFHAFVAENSQGKLIGMALYYLTFSTWKGRMLYLEDFVVTEAYRRRGIGRLLFEAVVTEACHLNCPLMKWQVLDWNEPAIRFYESIGASIERNWYNGKLFFTEKMSKNG